MYLFLSSINVHAKFLDYKKTPKDSIKRHAIFICQENQIISSNNRKKLTLKRKPFSILFSLKKYGDANVARIAAITSKKNLKKLKPGLDINEKSALGSGWAMACGSNGYEYLIFRDDAHHYFFYQNKDDKRGELIEKNGDLYKMKFEIRKFWFYYQNKEVAIQNSKINKFYLVIFIDRNNNKIIDKSELTTLKIKLR